MLDIMQDPQLEGCRDHRRRLAVVCVEEMHTVGCRVRIAHMQVQEKSAVTDLPICPLHGVTLAFMEAPWEDMAAHLRIMTCQTIS